MTKCAPVPLSTRYLGEFPDFLKTIEEVIASAKEQVVICCEYPAYAFISNPEGSLLYRQAIERKISSGVSVTIICLELEAVNLRTKKFRGVTSWESRTADPYFRDHLKNYLKRKPEYRGRNAREVEDAVEKEINEMSENDYQNLTFDERFRTLEHTFKNANIRKISETMSIYFWMADQKKAVFSFPSCEKKGSEHGFITTDPDLIRAFVENQKRYEAESKIHKEPETKPAD